MDTNVNRFSSKRIVYGILNVLLFLIGNVAFLLRADLLLDEMLCYFVIGLGFIGIFLLTLVTKRQEGTLYGGTSGSYRTQTIFLLVVWVVFYVLYYLPDYFVPFLAIAIFLRMAFDEATTFLLGIYFLILHCGVGGLNNYVFYCYLILFSFGVVLTKFLDEKNKLQFLYFTILVFFISFFVPVIFYYFTYLEIETDTFALALLAALLCVAFVIAFHFLHAKMTEKARDTQFYDAFLKEDYPLVVDIKNFSKAEYYHAIRCSNLSFSCAKEIGAKEMTCRMAGFYYRLGKMEGEPEIANALKLASAHCFPSDVMDIMEEAGGEVRLPQTKESAIVHMVDALVTKIELLDTDTMSSTWNQDMVIYQTLNELSQSGIYDESGLGMNEFLRLREMLVAKESLL